MTALRRIARKLRCTRPFLGLVMTVVMVGFAAAPTPLSPEAFQAQSQELLAAQEAADYAVSPQAAAAVRAVFAPRKAPTYPSAPAPGIIEHSSPLGAPAPLTTPSTSFAFLHTSADGTPVRYDPCRAIHYVTREENAPEGGERILKDSIAAISRGTGLVFIDDGATTEAPPLRNAFRPAYQPDRYGDRWAPVLITWATAGEEPEFSEATRHIGLGSSDSRQLNGSPLVYVTGNVNLNASALRTLMAKPRGAEIVQATIEHELGHLLGLGHTSSEGQVMNPEINPDVSDYRPGDLAGLAILGQGICESRF